jgi:protein-tyrosine-phosphatase
MGSASKNHRFKKDFTRYLIVSNDGMARGVMALGYFQKRLSERHLNQKIRVDLAGLIVPRGLKPHKLAVQTLKKNRLSLNGSNIQPVSEESLGQADVLIALSPENYYYLQHTYRTQLPKVRILNVPVLLPAADAAAYEKAFRKIAAGLDQELLNMR